MLITSTAPRSTPPMAMVVPVRSGSCSAGKMSANGIGQLLPRGVGDDMDRVGAHDIDDHDGRARWEGRVRSDRLVLDYPVLQRQRDFPGALPLAGNREIHGAGRADGAVNRNGPVVVEPEHPAHGDRGP